MRSKEVIVGNKAISLFRLACLLFGVNFLNPTRKVRGGKSNFTKVFENKELKRKLVNYFDIISV